MQLFIIVAVVGLLLTTLFRLIVVAHFVYWNWMMMTSFEQWGRFFLEYPGRDGPLDDVVPPDGFLPGYRTTAMGFPIIQAFFEPFGVILAITGVVLVGMAEMGARRKEAMGAYMQGAPK